LHYVDDLLEVTKLEAGRVEPEYADTDVARLARFVASHFEGVARTKGMSFVIEAPDALRAEVDDARLQRVLLNLLSNAFKFTPEGGQVRLTVREDTARERVVFEVADSGPGIPPDKREAVFNAYVQLEARTTRRFAGTGLGLSIARELVALHSGSIAASDAKEHGALLVVELPRRAPSGATVKPMRSGAPTELADEARSFVDEIRSATHGISGVSGRAGAPIVLVVEDNPDMSDALVEALSRSYRVATAFDGKEGLRKAIELAPDLVITDVMMPEMSGEELGARATTSPSRSRWRSSSLASTARSRGDAPSDASARSAPRSKR
jgi:CheY-like chemotaxis protein